jgi:triphosphoribosyl-dephospho-CoA synthase
LCRRTLTGRCSLNGVSEHRVRTRESRCVLRRDGHDARLQRPYSWDWLPLPRRPRRARVEGALCAILREEPSARVLANLGHDEIAPFARALEVAGGEEVLASALSYALGAGKDTTLRDAMRFSASRHALAREYARDFEVTRELARPALLSSLSREDSVRGALVQAYLEVLSEVPDLDVAGRAGRQEAEEVSRMAHGVLKAGGVHSRRGLEGIANLGGLLRADPRLSPTTTEYPVIAAAFLVALEYGPDALSHRLRPATGR